MLVVVKNIAVVLLISLITLLNTTEGKWSSRINNAHQQQQFSVKAGISEIGVKNIIANNIMEDNCTEGHFSNGTICGGGGGAAIYCHASSCLNGHCNKKGECICNIGFTFDNITQDCMPSQLEEKITETAKCRSGYEFNAISEKCEAICNATPDNDLNKSKHLNLLCSTNCKLGNCFYPAYLNRSLKSLTIPHAPECSQYCGYGNCSAPHQQCQCHEGYTLNRHTTLCEPICLVKCPPHSKCVQPNLCKCNVGFKTHPHAKTRCSHLSSNVFSYAGSISQTSYPSSRDILNRLIRPDNCGQGYKYDMRSKKCQPSCHNDCLHGNCTAPDVCVCLPGYSLDVQTQSCKANLCKWPCPRGYCQDNGDCVCPEGLTKSLLRGSGCEELYAHTTKVVFVFICIAALIAVIIWLITLAERRRGDL